MNKYVYFIYSRFVAVKVRGWDEHVAHALGFRVLVLFSRKHKSTHNSIKLTVVKCRLFSL